MLHHQDISVLAAPRLFDIEKIKRLLKSNLMCIYIIYDDEQTSTRTN